jgi:hypothetical protein
MQKGKGIEKKDKNGSMNATPGGSGTTTPAVEATGEVVGKLWELELEDTVCFPEGKFFSSSPFFSTPFLLA